MSRKSNPSQLIGYVLRYATKDKKFVEDKDEATIVLRKNLRNRNIDKIIDEFATNETFRIYRRKDSVVLFHNIISFSPHSTEFLDDIKLKEIAKKFVEMRAPNCLSLVVAHRGKTAHTHLHAVTSGVQLNGRSSRVSKAQFKHIKLELERFQKERFPELEHSTIEHVKPIQKNRTENLEYFKKSRQSNKETILSFLEKTATKARSEGDFLTQLKGRKYEPYYRGGQLQGVISQGQKYRFSRLGFETEGLNKIWGQHRQEEMQLSEIKNIRQKKSRELDKEVKPPVEAKEIRTGDNEMLEELASIRRRSNQRELTSRNLELIEK